MKPCGARLVLRPLGLDQIAEQTSGGLYLPQSAADRQRYRQWVVVSTGPDVVDEALLPGAEVLVQQYGGVPVRFADQDLLVIAEEHVVAVLT